MKTPDIIIAIDGYSSTGKSSFAKLVAAKLGFLYLDSGALYRGVTLYAIENGLIGKDGRIDEEGLRAALGGLDLHFENHGEGSRLYNGTRCIEKEIRGMEVSAKVSSISALAFVRNYVDSHLRAAGKDKKVVMDGRDIGTTVFPEAELKIFMTADPQVRAQRRADELKAKGEDVDIQEVLENIKERDYIDSHREVSPLVQAPDALVLDNSDMSFEEEMDWIMDIIEKRF